MKRRYNLDLWVVATMIALAIVFCSCSNKGSSPSYDVNAKLGEAWSSFGTGSYDAALTTFSDVLTHSANNSEALSGRGWCHAFKKEYSTAITDFNSSIQQNSNTDAKMGLAAVYRDLPDLQAAITNTSAVITADSHYVFAKKTSIDYKDAHLIKAQCYFRLGKGSFSSAHTEVNYLCVLLGLAGLPDPNTLSPAEYEKQLGQRLVDLSARIGD
jgi:tetratricopeptide (TPR) repeat protein